jgi:site-specific DNA recombinase
MQKDKRCALYLRSSKDRHDVSIAAQRHELTTLAKSKSLTVATEFSDAVERADDWQRPGYLELLRAISDPGRTWNTLITLDASRIARDDDLLRATFTHECKKRGVRLLYGKFPSVNPMYDVIVQNVDTLMSKLHSMMSREKSLGGMAENVRQGYRAGGRAPYGYKLARIPTGAMRDGAPVTKSRLAPSELAPAIARYLKGRAKGMNGSQLARECGLKISRTSLVGVEWNALTYAGHTVWNVASSTAKRRPRSEWHMKRDTHPPLITEADAEQILTRLERRAQVRTKGADYLLSGILVAPGGRRWHGDGAAGYRCGSRRVSAAALERAVLGRLAEELRSADFARGCLERARADARPRHREAELRALQRRIDELERKAARVRNLVPEMQHPEGMLRMLDGLEAERLELTKQAAELAESVAGDQVLTLITETHLAEVMRSFAAGLVNADRGQVKQRLRAVLEQISLDPKSLTCRLHYAIPVVTGDNVASPRRPDAIPGLPAALIRAHGLVRLLAGSRRRLRRAA